MDSIANYVGSSMAHQANEFYLKCHFFLPQEWMEVSGELVGLEPMGYLCNLPIKNNGSSKNKFLMNPLKEMVEYFNELNKLISTGLPTPTAFYMKTFHASNNP